MTCVSEIMNTEKHVRILARMLNEDELRDAVLLVFANKQDLPSAMNATEMTEKLNLNSMRDRNWYIQPPASTSGDGVQSV